MPFPRLTYPHRDDSTRKEMQSRGRHISDMSAPACKGYAATAVAITENYSKEWITTPERSFGSNHVVFGGMMLPVSAMLISCCIETG